MAGLKITDSPNISLWDSRIFSNICDGEFIIDASPSAFLGSGADNVLGARVQIKNPYDVIIKAYGSGYDIPSPITATYEFDMPTQAGKIQYGVYKVALQLTDADSSVYVIEKSINVCSYTSDSNPCDERVRMTADCKNGRVLFQLSEPPTFKGIFAESKVQSVRIDYPTASGLAALNTTVGNFSMALFQGVYKATVNVCASYDMGNNIWLQLPYEVITEKNVKCLLDYTCIWPAIKKINDRIVVCTSEKEKQSNTLIILDALRLLKTAELANEAGEDASDYISDLEKLLGCTCTCDCSGSPIVNNTPSTNVSIEGCLVEAETVGLTTVYTIGAKNYFLTVDDSQNVLGISGIADYGCTIYQQLTFNSEAAYELIKSEINSSEEYLFFAAVINNVLSGIDATCLGYNPSQWQALTFAQKIEAIKVSACSGGSCAAAVTGVSTAQSGSNVVISFTQTVGFSSDIYVNGIFMGNVLAGINEFTLIGFADGAEHDYSIIPKCSNGSNGTAFTGTFGYLACAFISPPSISDSTINGVTCPYDLTTLVYPTPPLGIEVEWHTANNTLSSSLVADPESVSSGVYYAFAKDADGCYSTASVVTLVCDGGTSCTAPQSLLVVDSVGGFKVSFLSANFPPPSNSYTVKRKAFADPDVDGSYTTIGTPVYNGSSGRWEITDTTASDNVLYTYKAISNCGASTPSVTYTFANLDCPVVSLTPSATEMDYSFTGVGGEVDKYEVSLYDSTGAVLLSTQTIVPAFSTPITGTFTYLTEGTIYKIRVKVFISTFYKTCSFTTAGTGGSVNGLVSSTANPNQINGITVNGIAVTYVSGDNFPILSLQSGTFNTDQIGSSVTVVVVGSTSSLVVRYFDTDGVIQFPVIGVNTYTFSNVKLLPGGSNWNIQVNN